MSYLSELRKIVGHRPLLSAGATVLVIKDGKILLNLRSDTETWGVPGGALELGESLEETAYRELKEETGLCFFPYEGGDEAFRRPVFLGAGMTDETSTTVFGFADGSISDGYKEDTESIEVLLVDKEEAKRILRQERVSLRAAFLLMQFLSAKKEEPFAFLDVEEK